MKKSLLLALFLCLGLVLAACGGSDNGSESGGDSEQTAEESSGSESDSSEMEEGSSGSGNTLDVTATNFEFDQSEYKVSAGEEVTVKLTSKEGVHGLAIDEFNVDIQESGTATFTPEEPGEYNIHCSVPCGEGHAGMESTLIVE